jgi:hypothetical protein
VKVQKSAVTKPKTSNSKKAEIGGMKIGDNKAENKGLEDAETIGIEAGKSETGDVK